MYQKPKSAKRLYFDVIPRNVDEYLNFLDKFCTESPMQKLENPVWHVHAGSPPRRDTPLTFAVLLNLASVCNAENKQVLWGFITRYAPDANPEKNKMLDSLVEFSIRYYRDFVKPKKKYRSPSKKERSALIDLAKTLEKMSSSASAEDLQKKVYKAGKDNGFDNLRDWFKACYEVLFGQEQGPRMGSFIELYGVSETVNLIRRSLDRDQNKNPKL